MKIDEPLDAVASMERRAFFGAVGKYGFTTALIAASSGALLSGPAMAQTRSTAYGGRWLYVEMKLKWHCQTNLTSPLVNP